MDKIIYPKDEEGFEAAVASYVKDTFRFHVGYPAYEINRKYQFFCRVSVDFKNKEVIISVDKNNDEREITIDFNEIYTG